MAAETQPARVVGPYNIGQVIGRGTIGKVHEAIHIPSKRKMAMKVISRHELIDPALGTRVRREIAIAKLLKHPHVVSVSVQNKNYSSNDSLNTTIRSPQPHAQPD